MQTVESRLWSCVFAVILGLAMATFGVLRVSPPDRWLWLGAATILLVLGSAGVLFAERAPRVSTWSVLWLIVLFVVGVVPLVWAFSLAVDPQLLSTGRLLPSDLGFDRFSRLLRSSEFRSLAWTSASAAVVSAVIATVAALLVAYPLARGEFRGRRIARGAVWVLFFVPVAVLVGPWSGQLTRIGGLDTGWGLVSGTLLISVPFATLALMLLFDRVPWRTFDLARIEGGSGRQAFWRLAPALVVPKVVAIFAGAFVLVWNDLVAAAVTTVASARTVPLTLRDAESASGVALVTLVWFLPALVALVIAASAARERKD